MSWLLWLTMKVPSPQNVHGPLFLPFSAGLDTYQEVKTAVCFVLGNLDETVFDVSAAPAPGFEAQVLESLKGQQHHF